MRKYQDTYCREVKNYERENEDREINPSKKTQERVSR